MEIGNIGQVENNAILSGNVTPSYYDFDIVTQTLRANPNGEYNEHNEEFCVTYKSGLITYTSNTISVKQELPTDVYYYLTFIIDGIVYEYWSDEIEFDEIIANFNKTSSQYVIESPRAYYSYNKETFYEMDITINDSYSKDWVHIYNEIKSETDDQIYIIIDKNYAPSERTSYFYLNAGDIEIQFKLNQEAGDGIVLYKMKLKEDMNDTIYSYKGESTKNYTLNYGYKRQDIYIGAFISTGYTDTEVETEKHQISVITSITQGSEWASMEYEEDFSQYALYLQQNNTASPRNATITITHDGGKVAAILHITQAANDNYLYKLTANEGNLSTTTYTAWSDGVTSHKQINISVDYNTKSYTITNIALYKGLTHETATEKINDGLDVQIISENADWITPNIQWSQNMMTINFTQNTSQINRVGVIRITNKLVNSHYIDIRVTQSKSPGQMLTIDYTTTTTNGKQKIFTVDKTVNNFSLYVKDNGTFKPISESSLTITEQGTNYYAYSYQPTTVGGFTIGYTFNDGIITTSFRDLSNVTAATVIMSNVSDSSSINKFAVPFYYFNNCQNLQVIDFEKSNISHFYANCNDCTSLSKVILPDTATYVGGFQNTALKTLGPKNSSTTYDIGIPLSCNKITTFEYSKLENIILSGNIETVDSFTFKYCENLTSVTMSDNIIKIGNSAFKYCTKLPSLKFSSGLTEISTEICYGCGSLTSITINSTNTKTIESKAFANCDLRSYDSCIPTGITKIDGLAFRNNKNLDKINISSSLVEIGFDGYETPHGRENHSHPNFPSHNYGNEYCYNPFAGCSNVTSVTVNSTNPKYVSRNNGVYPKMKVRGSESTYLIIGCKNTKIESDTTMIENCAFEQMITAQTAIALTDKLTRIGYDAFYGCNITSVTIPSNVEIIDTQAFYFNRFMNNLYFGSNSKVTEIWSNSFHLCGIKTIVSFPQGCKFIGDEVFSNNSIASFKLPPLVEYVGDGILALNETLTSLTVDTSNQYFTSSYNNKEYNVILNTNHDELFMTCNNTESLFSVPVIKIHTNSYCNYNSNTTELSLPETAEIIEESPFASLKYVKKLYIRQNATKINRYLFSGLENGTLTDVYCYQTKCPFDSYTTYIHSSLKNVTLHVKSNLVSEYRSNFGKELDAKSWILKGDL